MRDSTGAPAPSTSTFGVSADRAPAQQVKASSSFDAVITAIEAGAQRVEVEPSEAELIEADLHNLHLKNSGESERRRVEATHVLELRALAVRGLLR